MAKKNSRKIIRISLTIISSLTLLATLLMIFNEKSLHDTVTDIIVLLVGSIALVMAIFTEVEIENQAKRSLQIHKEIIAALEEIRDLNQDNEYLKRKLREDSNLDKKIFEELKNIDKNHKYIEKKS